MFLVGGESQTGFETKQDYPVVEHIASIALRQHHHKMKQSKLQTERLAMK